MKPQYGDKTQDQMQRLLQTVEEAVAPQQQPAEDYLPYLRMNYNGKDLYVSAILENQAKAKLLIAAMTAMVPFLPQEEEHNDDQRDRQRTTRSHGND